MVEKKKYTVRGGVLINDEARQLRTKITNVRMKLYFAVFLVIIVFVIGAYAYEQIENWDTLTAVYFMTSTMTTVGYGDVIPKTWWGRVLTTIFMWVGISVGFYLIYTISEFREKEVDERLINFMNRIETGRQNLRERFRGS